MYKTNPFKKPLSYDLIAFNTRFTDQTHPSNRLWTIRSSFYLVETHWNKVPPTFFCFSWDYAPSYFGGVIHKGGLPQKKSPAAPAFFLFDRDTLEQVPCVSPQIKKASLRRLFFCDPGGIQITSFHFSLFRLTSYNSSK